ncbi:molybdopterin molybdotransferase MoeA [Halobacillus litoralis]|uniref:molybdopterin molybdotransferase MoeA n=1 Tax=Halobacillus litoralis TaxID=45668 RepID=UPI001CD2E527|nr:gephyrin-like molybdotransferase Glp [Halobacillus litoralis]MCA0969488.1 molybdopterin molybdotransferase MoeA [Halobacillus litoralis]
MNLHRTPLPVKDAVDKVMNREFQQKAETVEVVDSLHRTLAEDIMATHAVPPFNKSPYDGFAFRSEDTVELSREKVGHFRVIETVPAGFRASRHLREGEAVRIMTGAEIPNGADCVAMFEVCHPYQNNGEEWVSVKRPFTPGQNVMEKGSETEEGEVLVRKGKQVNPGVQALLATFGYNRVQVYRRPVIGVFATGSELLDVDEPMQPGKIRNSNAYMILAQIERAGGRGIYFGKLEDDFDTCYRSVAASLNQVDCLITTGGVSVGDYDLMPDIYEKLGADVLFNKVAMRPGSVTTVADCKGKLLFGLSGNPSACYVGFELFTYPVLQALIGKKDVYHKRIMAVLGKDFKKPNPFTRFVRGFISYQEGKVYVYPAGLDKSAVVTSLASTNVLIQLRGGTKGYENGDRVEALLLEESDGQDIF